MIMLRIWHHMDGRQDEDRPPYKLTIRQVDLCDEFMEAAEAVVAGQARETGLTDEKMKLVKRQRGCIGSYGKSQNGL